MYVCMYVRTQFALTMYVCIYANVRVCLCVCRSKLRELFPVTAFAGGVALNDNGMDLLSRMLNMDPAQVRTPPSIISYRTPYPLYVCMYV